MSTSLTLFALRNVDLRFYFGYEIPPGQLQALNAIWIFLLGPIVAWVYQFRATSGGDFSIASKFAMGFAVLAVGFFAFAVSGQFAEGGRVSVWWMVAGYGLVSLGELLISGLGLAMVARHVGPRLRGFTMGLWFLASGISQYLGSYVANFAEVPENLVDPMQTLPIYVRLFNGLGLVATAGTVVALLMLPLMRRLSPAVPAVRT